MRRIPLALLLLLAVALAPALAAGPATFPVIVVFKDAADLAPLAGYYVPDERAQANPQAWGYQDRGVLGAVQALENAHGFRSDFVYGAAIRGFAARLTARQIADLEDDPAVAFVEADGTMHAIVQTLPWGIDRVDADISSTLAGNGSGEVSNVNVYIIDTGIDTGHADLNVVRHVNFAGGQNRDCHGHGTHVAGTASARDNTSDVVGVSPGSPLTGVKVLGCNGSGSTSGVIAGIDWVTANRVLPASANMSLGGGASTALDNAVKNSAASGVFYALAAGNNGGNACNTSPARAGAGNNGIVTVAATDINNNEASFSNFGSCVDIWAPGVSVLSTRRGGGTTTFSGTSMASPHVAGGGALYLSNNTGASPTAVENALKAAAVSTGTNSKDGAAIKLLNVGTF